MKPPRLPLDWDRVSHYSFLEEFPLLQETRNDILAKPWTRPEVRETMRLARRIERAREEITNANREIRRLHTSIRDEEQLVRAKLQQLKDTADPLYSALQEYWRRRSIANTRNMTFVQ